MAQHAVDGIARPAHLLLAAPEQRLHGATIAASGGAQRLHASLAAGCSRLIVARRDLPQGVMLARPPDPVVNALEPAGSGQLVGGVEQRRCLAPAAEDEQP